MSEKTEAHRIPVGRIVGAFGIKGLVKVELLTQFEGRLAKGETLYLDGEPMVVQSSQIHKGRHLLGFKEVPDATAAERLQWKTLEADDKGDLALEEDEYLSADLVGLLVVTSDGRPLGKVDEVLAYPAHDLLKVDRLLIPAVKQFVKKVDLEERMIVVELIEGMEEG